MNEHLRGQLGSNLELQQAQQLALTPALKQSLHILAMPTLELCAYLRAQVEQNPVLEMDEYSEEADMAHHDGEHTLIYDEAAYEESWQRYLNAAQYEPHLYAASSHEAAPPELSVTLPARDEQGLITLLRLQLALKEAMPAVKSAAEQIIEHLDEDGYLSLPLCRLAAENSCDEKTLSEALVLVQSLEPSGVAARDLRECLRLQIRADEPERELLIAVIDNHLTDVAANRVRDAANALKIGVPQIKKAFQHIRTLVPHPASHYGGVTAPYIAADVIIRKVGEEYQIFLNDRMLPRLYISPFYRRPNRSLFQDKEASDYIKRALGEAESLLRNVEKRRRTMCRLALLTAEHQLGFWEQGLAALLPLTMKEAGEALSLHESTVSRAISGKYVQTPRGLYPWKFFFPRAYAAKPGAPVPAWAKEQIKELIIAEDKARPLSDQQLSGILEQRGLKLARRTVAKYREELGIAARHLRRE